MILGLSLTSQAVVWVLVDDADRAIVDHDELTFQPGTEIARAAARGAGMIAAAGGHRVDRIRLTWDDDVSRDGIRLAAQLIDLGIADVETVPLAHALGVMVAPDTAPGLALAYGAAVAQGPIESRGASRGRRGLSRRRIAVAVLGAAAAALLAGLLVTSGTAPRVEQTAAVTEQTAPTGTGWVAVSAPTSATAGMVRKVVEPVEEDASPVWTPAPRAYVAAAPAPAPTPAAVAVPHLTAPEAVPTPQEHLTGEWPGPAVSVPVVQIPLEMTDPAILFSALP
ncbi:hypothetical protein C6A87_014030 [Mycobacterium sp. ITM-2016-00317]|uniref:hypothetical protein n=1 Tax=Mycobacterium sp. ITM-2016-00317 TaxID=2099694 RepID=UPI00287FDD6F|nr:hypothetical protein [Mycobacterium sp. ITM-2016-00317]WNG90328.1 hypothetical protein C6A87_014030 [Mycobacterium sp. ITM-2016-00317]